ncbi:FecR family protein [Chitinophaga pinensis]|uniref:Anti-FecI sigma factor, FecR n=1 Tax=Chitinophaga pinensis (strain ATCC 43595 / DSM 2588 / LMG 13176 / NBRC 15968 / NCIMB 11800 / UQM 2034) TaxID=485918 RepID=A0A979G460_CHIPD|nr:FecR family protein [Chitinophaga pinensis]ACU60361.1 anti-FecI sigma factor, FecR [Chitinophaga pinensis DSM 2588]
MNQPNNPDRINLLAQKWQEGTITAEEREEFEKWYNNFDNSLEINSDESQTAMEQRLYSLIAQKGNIRTKQTIKWPRLAAAASILLCLSIGSYYYIRQGEVKQAAKVINQDVSPGSNKATLTLSNGQQISLNDAGNGPLAVQGNTNITKTSDGNLAYEPADKHTPVSASIIYNTVTTPLGGQYHLSLADGSEVWLNAGSSIKYPTSFNGTERKVEITGEVYFEIAHNAAKPFRVLTSQQVVEVLGTHFNVNAYLDETDIKTTLLEGSVKVTGSNNTKIIQPGEQAVLNSNGLNVTKADLEEAVAWKNGEFRFNDEKIGSIMRKLSRWYDIEVTFKGPVPEEGFNGKISRYKNISQALKMLEKTKAVHFQIEGKKVVVTQ